MAKNEVKISLETQLEEAERRGHRQGMAYLLDVLSDANFDPLHGPLQGWGDYEDGSPQWRACLTAAMIGAAKLNQAELVKFLLDAGADANTRTESDSDVDDNSGTVLHDAVRDGYTEVVQALLDAGANTGYDVKNSIPLAASHGQAESVALLIEAGCDVNAQYATGETVLMLAAEGKEDGSLDTNHLLLEAGAEVIHEDGRTASDCAAEAGSSEVEISLQVQLEEAERNGHKQGMAYLSSVLSAAPFEQLYFPQQGYTDEYASPFLRARLSAAMIGAAKDNQPDLVEFLLKAGADANCFTEIGKGGDHDYSSSVLYDAAKDGYTKVVQALLLRGANPNFRYQYKDWEPLKTPLISAAAGGHTEIVKALLVAGADVHNGEGPENADWLIDYSAEGDHAEMTQILLEFEADPDAYYSCYPLISAASYGKKESAALLIKAGCDVNAQYATGETVLMIASEGNVEGSIETIRLLLNAGAEINYKRTDGRTALMYAAEAGHSEAVRLLLSAGADVFSQAQSREARHERPATIAGNAYDLANNDAVKLILRSEMHRRIAAALSVLPTLPVGVRQKIIHLYTERN